MAKKSKKTAPPAIAGKTAGTSIAGRVSSPTSTGGAGTFFEQHVDAYWLAQLLVRGIPPILHEELWWKYICKPSVSAGTRTIS